LKIKVVYVSYLTLEVITGLGLGLVAEIMFGFGPGSVIAIKRKLEHFGLSRANIVF
jgi:hypothetical protein